MLNSDLVYHGDWILIDGEIYVVARVVRNQLALINVETGNRWSEPTDDCGVTPIGNFTGERGVADWGLCKRGPIRKQLEGRQVDRFSDIDRLLGRLKDLG